MDNTVIDLLQLSDTSSMTLGFGSNKTNYVSLIKVNGKPILPPLMDEEKRKEMQKYKQKAIELEHKLSEQKKIRSATRGNQISSEVSSIKSLPPSRQSTPARPASLNLADAGAGKTFVLHKKRTGGSSPAINTNNTVVKSEKISSQRSARAFKSSLEQRLAIEDGTSKSIVNECQQSPITEELAPDSFAGSESDISKEIRRWSPLQIESINSLKIQLPPKGAQYLEENVDVSLDESLNTPDTVTHSPSLMRQNSYTLLTPSPALLQFLETQKDQQPLPKPQSGRKTWDLTKARKNWDSKNGALEKSSDEEECKEVCVQFWNKKYSTSLDSFSVTKANRTNDPEDCDHSLPNSLAYDSGTSPESYSLKKKNQKNSKVKCKFKGKKVRSTKSVPSPDSADKVPFRDLSNPGRGSLHDMTGGESELPDLSDLLLQMKVDFERQRKELEERQQSEMKKLEIVFQRREAELLSKVGHLSRVAPKSIYSQSSRESWPRDSSVPDSRMMGDGHQNRCGRKEHSFSEHSLGQYGSRRPHSAKDFHPQCCPHDTDCGRRARSMDFNQTNQDTDLDVSFQDDFIQSKDTTLNNEYIIESDSFSNFSSQSSTVSSDNRQEQAHAGIVRKFQGISSEEYVKYSQAASKINAGVRGYLTRRLLRTAHVQGLITTLKDAITCATQLHTASDIADSDIDLMRRLGRQIEAAWEAVYAVFFNTETSAKLQLIATDRERLRAAIAKTPAATSKKKRISSATKKSLDRKKGTPNMSKSQTSNGLTRVRMCSKMAASYPAPYYSQKLK